MEKEARKILTGVVCRYIHNKRYGFIRSDEDGRTYFAHWSQLVMAGYHALTEGDVVSFTIGEDKNGRTQAIQVIPIVTFRQFRRILAERGYRLSMRRDDYGRRIWTVSDRATKELLCQYHTLLEVVKWVEQMEKKEVSV